MREVQVPAQIGGDCPPKTGRTTPIPEDLVRHQPCNLEIACDDGTGL